MFVYVYVFTRAYVSFKRMTPTCLFRHDTYSHVCTMTCAQEIAALQGEAARLEDQLAEATARVSSLVQERDDVRLAAERERLVASETERRLDEELRQSQQRLQDSSRMLQVCEKNPISCVKEPYSSLKRAVSHA